MAQSEYTTIIMGTPDKKGRRWVTTSPDPKKPGKQVGEAEKRRIIGSLWQGARLLETALKEMGADGWGLVSHSMHGPGLGGLTGTAVLRRPASEVEEGTA